MIKLNLTKAIERSLIMLEKQAAKETAQYAKTLLRLDTIAGMTNFKDETNQKLLKIARDAKAKIQDIRNKLAIDKAQTKDTVAKAQMSQKANEQIIQIEADAQKQAQTIKDEQAQFQASQQEALATGPIPPSIPTPDQLTTQEATTLVTDATTRATIESMPPL